MLLFAFVVIVVLLCGGANSTVYYVDLVLEGVGDCLTRSQFCNITRALADSTDGDTIKFTTGGGTTVHWWNDTATLPRKNLTFTSEVGVLIRSDVTLTYMLERGGDSSPMSIWFFGLDFVGVQNQMTVGTDPQDPTNFQGILDDTSAKPIEVHYDSCTFVDSYLGLSGRGLGAYYVSFRDVSSTGSTLLVGVAQDARVDVWGSTFSEGFDVINKVYIPPMTFASVHGDATDHTLLDDRSLFICSDGDFEVSIHDTTFRGYGPSFIGRNLRVSFVDSFMLDAFGWSPAFGVCLGSNCNCWLEGEALCEAAMWSPTVGVRVVPSGTADVSVVRSTFDNVRGYMVGGGMLVSSHFGLSVSVSVEDSVFTRNTAFAGAGFFVTAPSVSAFVSVKNCTFSNQEGLQQEILPTRGTAFTVQSRAGNVTVEVSDVTIQTEFMLPGKEIWNEDRRIGTGIYVLAGETARLQLADVRFVKHPNPTNVLGSWVPDVYARYPYERKRIDACPLCYHQVRWTGGWLTALGKDVVVDIDDSEFTSGLFQAAFIEGTCGVSLNVRNSSFASVLREEAIATIGEAAFQSKFEIAKARGGAFSVAKTSDACVNDGLQILVDSSTFDGFGVADAGGAFFVSDKGSLGTARFLNSEFREGNAAQAGAVYFEGSSSSLLRTDGSTFRKNSARFVGGSVFVHGSSTEFEDSTFEDGEALRGGAAVISGGQLSVLSSKFRRNVAKLEGGALYVATSNSVIDTSSFEQNRVSIGCDVCLGGGAIAILASRDFSAPTISTTVTSSNCSDGSSPKFGGCISTRFGHLSVTGSLFSNSSTSGKGGAVYGQTAQVEVDTSTFEACSAGSAGGGISVDSDRSDVFSLKVTNSAFRDCGSATQSSGGGISAVQSLVHMTACTFSGCKALSGGAGYLESSRLFLGSPKSVFETQFDIVRAVAGAFLFCYVLPNNTGWVGIPGGKNSTLPGRLKFDVIGTTSFVNNEAEEGGALYTTDSSMFVHAELVSFFANDAHSTGGAIWSKSTHEEWANALHALTPVTFVGNKAMYGSSLAMTAPGLPLGYCLKMGSVVPGAPGIAEQVYFLQTMSDPIEEVVPKYLKYECLADPGTNLDCTRNVDIGSVPERLVPSNASMDSASRVFDFLSTPSNEVFRLAVRAVDSFGRHLPTLRGLTFRLSANASISTTSGFDVNYDAGEASWEDLRVDLPARTVVYLTVSIVEYPSVWATMILHVMACPPGFQPNPLSGTGCVPCGRTQFKLTTGATKCLDCPVGATCEGSTVKVHDGFWGRPTVTGSVDVMRCKQKTCGGGQIEYSTPHGMSSLECGDSCIHTVYNCSNNRDGSLCSLCAEGFGEWAGSCRPCSSNARVNAAPLILFLLLPALSIGYSRGHNQLLVCLVIFGKAYKQAQVITGCKKQEGYDSHISGNGTEVVIFDPDQVLPCYRYVLFVFLL